jgi:hypothetical protein
MKNPKEIYPILLEAHENLTDAQSADLNARLGACRTFRQAHCFAQKISNFDALQIDIHRPSDFQTCSIALTGVCSPKVRQAPSPDISPKYPGRTVAELLAEIGPPCGCPKR